VTVAGECDNVFSLKQGSYIELHKSMNYLK